MPEVQIAVEHVIFTRVERTYSPQGYSGYQIVYQSPSLGAETAQIEKYVQCFQPGKQPVRRHQFFWTEKGQAVFTRSVPLTSPDPEVIDKNQRDAFLVHALVVSREHFARVRNDPFAIFAAAENNQLLTTDVAQLVAYLRKDPPPTQLVVPIRSGAMYPPEWSVWNLYLLCVAAPNLHEQKQSILMIAADPEEIFQLLSCMLAWLPADQRVACTFDTFVDHCTPPAGNFWIVGGTRSIGNSSFISMPLAERKVVSLKGSDERSLYTTWFAYALQNTESDAQINEDLYTAQVVAEVFTAHRALPAFPLSKRALNTFYNLNSRAITTRLAKALATVLPGHIAELLAPSLHTYIYEPLPTILSIAAQETCDTQMLAHITLAKIVYYWLLNEQPEWKEWESVLTFSEQATYMPLILLANVKAKARPQTLLSSMKARSPFFSTSDDKPQAQDVAVGALLKTGELPQVLDELLAGVQPVQDPLPSDTAQAARQSQSSSTRRLQLSDEEFQMLVNALLHQQAGNLLQGRCVWRVEYLQNSRIVRSLVKAVDASQNVAAEFVHALHHHPLYSR
ncbi:hypothetical protein KDAU_54470 [Dictyobacter aurantiacus]|uniref:Uncharacterized protein n=2 Tax=Dictyobacter aurantiacus TaxID=1936993 RepID=A0A401ZMN8_9CHLR|nr:hypothetical protein KDAU_54470 [Dictyobacter aurantiacus]